MEDALSATRAAVEEGIVPGGGVALVRASRALEKAKIDGDEAIGANIIKGSLDIPLRLIVQNAGQEGAVVLDKVRQARTTTATTPSWGSMPRCSSKGSSTP